jgi:hypothetical protein
MPHKEGLEGWILLIVIFSHVSNPLKGKICNAISKQSAFEMTCYMV